MTAESACVSGDWVLNVLAFAYTLFAYVAKRELYIGPLFRLADAVLLSIYLVEFVFLAYLQDYFSAVGATMIAILIVMLVLILLHYLDSSALLIGILFLMSSYGLVWWLSGMLSIIVATGIACIIWYNELDYLSICFMDSGIISMVLLLSLVGIFTNFWPSNAPANCSSGHVNMVMVCENSCGCVLTDGSLKFSPWTWGVIVLVLTATRFVWVLYYEVCGKSARVKKDYEEQFPPRTTSCFCCNAEDRRDCCFCMSKCCALAKPLQKQPSESKQATKRPPEMEQQQDEEEEEEIQLQESSTVG